MKASTIQGYTPAVGVTATANSRPQATFSGVKQVQQTTHSTSNLKKLVIAAAGLLGICAVGCSEYNEEKENTPTTTTKLSTPVRLDGGTSSDAGIVLAGPKAAEQGSESEPVDIIGIFFKDLKQDAKSAD